MTARSRRIWILPAIGVLLLSDPAASRAYAEMVAYAWGPISGSGTYAAAGGDHGTFWVPDASVTIAYDPTDLSDSTIDFDLGSTPYGFGGETEGVITATASGDAAFLAGDAGSGFAITIVLRGGRAGPTDDQGHPLSLDGFRGSAIEVTAQGPERFAYAWTFAGAIVPEPPSGLLLATGAGVVGLALRRRGVTRRGRPRS